MTEPTLASFSFSSAWEVFVLFMIPVGGGIPAGVILAKSKGLEWPITAMIYFVSDVALACLFDPVMHLILRVGEKSQHFIRFKETLKKQTERTLEKYGANPGPFSLVMISFGIDPMTGRTAAHAAGHGFVAGWTIAILGDMLFFGVLMTSTLALNNVLGDGTWTAIIIMVAMMIVPGLIRRAREKWASLRAPANAPATGISKPAE